MRIPDYPSNREADEGTKTTAERREGVPEEEAKSGDLFTRVCSWDGARLCGSNTGVQAALPAVEERLFCSFEY